MVAYLNDDRQMQRSGLERHAQSIAISVAIALLLWSGSTIVDIRDRLSRFEEKLLTIQVQVNDANANHLRASDWRREVQIINERFDRLERDLDRRPK